MNSASGPASVAFGGGNQSSAMGSFAAGILNKATGGNAIAMGQSSQAVGDASIALGNSSLALGLNAVAIGQANEANEPGTLALGNTNKANAISAIAMGQENQANGPSSVAIGNTNVANGQSSVAIGHKLITTTQYTVALGMLNKVHTPSAPNERLFVLGNGTGETTALRSDAFTVLKNGKVGVDIDNFETTTSNAKLEVNGPIRVRPEDTTITCNASNEGSIRYFTIDTDNGEFRGCRKSAGVFSWVGL